MSTTTHTVKNHGQAKPVKVDHNRNKAIQYEFYIPLKVWKEKRGKAFISRLGSLEPGATIFAGLIGVWKGKAEETNIYRLILKTGLYDRKNVTDSICSEIGNMMAELSVSDVPNVPQDAFMYTETEIYMNLSSRL